MFGYIRPRAEELRVKENELYKAVYCGLCRTMRKRISFAAALSLNYDYVFLALLRAEVSGEVFKLCQKRCPLHPIKPRNCAGAKTDSPALNFVGKVHLALTYEKLNDDLRDPDTGAIKKCVFRLYRFFIRKSIKKQKKRDPEFSEILEAVTDSFFRLTVLEKEGCKDPDELAHTCGAALERTCAVGLEGSAKRALSACGACMGRLIYLLDAWDDLARDAQKGCYNPYLARYGTLEAARSHAEEIDGVLSLYAEELDRDVALVTHPGRYAPICENIVKLGIPAAIRRATVKHTVSNERESA